MGLAFDASGMLYISEDNNHHISVFTPEGEFVKTLGGPGQFQCPRGIVVNSNGVVYVCDKDNDRIQL